VKVINNTCFFATGNHLAPVGALVGKTIECKIDADMENPEEKKYSHNPLAELMADRGKYLTAAYTVLKAHACAGFPGAKGLGRAGRRVMSEPAPIVRNLVGLRLGDVLPGSTDNGGPGVLVTGAVADRLVVTLSAPGFGLNLARKRAFCNE
jgi:hypothetical protein